MSFRRPERPGPAHARLESIVRGLFLMAPGVNWLAPRYFPSESWQITAGLVMLGLNVFKGIPEKPHA